jgi:hypothetical protein
MMQDEHRVYPGLGRELCNALCPASLWIALMMMMIMCFEGVLPALYSSGGKVTDLRNLILADYNCCIYGGYDIYSNRLCFLDHQVVSTCSARFAEQFGDLRGPF